MTDEAERWKRIVTELQEVMTIGAIAQEIGVDPRQVWRWKEGDRPLGLKAVRLYLLHVEHVTRATVSRETDCAPGGKA